MKLLSFVNTNSSAGVAVGGSNVNMSSTQIKALPVPASAASQPIYALFDGLTGPVSTPIFSGAFQVFTLSLGVENLAKVMSASIAISASTYRPIFLIFAPREDQYPRA